MTLGCPHDRAGKRPDLAQNVALPKTQRLPGSQDALGIDTGKLGYATHEEHTRSEQYDHRDNEHDAERRRKVKRRPLRPPSPLHEPH
jgi:hypothetical protein